MSVVLRVHNIVVHPPVSTSVYGRRQPFTVLFSRTTFSGAVIVRFSRTPPPPNGRVLRSTRVISKKKWRKSQTKLVSYGQPTTNNCRSSASVPRRKINRLSFVREIDESRADFNTRQSFHARIAATFVYENCPAMYRRGFQYSYDFTDTELLAPFRLSRRN